MEVKEAERIVIAKPVATRPSYASSCSSHRSFSELLASAINVSPANTCPETSVSAIRPKTVRFKPLGMVSSKSEVLESAVVYPSNDKLESDRKSTVVYKPLAKLVSKQTVSLLANLGNYDYDYSHLHLQAPAQIEAYSEPKRQTNIHFGTDFGTNFHQNSQSETIQTSEASKTSTLDRSSSDGYNWRKYGQKQVKGSDYPRSYYKCTNPNCPVKKKVERSLDGEIAEIVYKGEHNHSKPRPRPPLTKHLNESRLEFDNGVGLSTCDPLVGSTTPENSCLPIGDHEDARKGVEPEDDEPKSKRLRKNEIRSSEAGISGEGVQEPRIVVQSSTDSEIIGDGFRWRKYGQKVVKGNPYPRSYYRCTNLKCNVRKHVERSLDDPTAFLTTYEGKHNHDMPSKTTGAVASEENSKVKS